MNKTIWGTSLSAVAASKIAPVDNPPLFIVIGSDDNTIPDAVRWMQGVMDSGKNKDGSRRYMSFYVNTDQDIAVWDKNEDIVNACLSAYKSGHEITNHTATHLACVGYDENETRASFDVIKAEIQRTQDVLEKNGIPKMHQTGFRTPYLRYSDTTFRVIQEIGFLYDCSISAADDNKAGDNYFPYTLDFDDGNGNFSPDNSAGRNSWGKVSPIGKCEGLWEIPAIRFAIDQKDYAYVEKTLKRKHGNDYKFDGYITGLDYNLWNEAEFNEEQTLRTLLNTIKLCLAGNRAPVTIGLHSQFYFEHRGDLYPNIEEPSKKQWAFEKFMEEASKLDDVFFVSGDMVIRWMQNPVSAKDFNPENYRRP